MAARTLLASLRWDAESSDAVPQLTGLAALAQAAEPVTADDAEQVRGFIAVADRQSATFE